MPDPDVDRLRSIKTFPSLVKYLRDELDWPIESEDFDDLTFDYEPEELGIDAKNAAKIQEIKQLRPLESNQPWGIFFVKFEPKRLPVVALRRVLRSLVIKKRASAARAQQATWQLHDLLFISSYGESEHRDITFAHFSEDPSVGDLPTLRVLGWDDEDTALHLGHAHHTLKEKLRWPDDPDDLNSWRTSWSSAFVLRHREVITTSQQLAVRLADLARSIRKRVNAVLAVESEQGPLRQLMLAFQQALIHDLDDDDFADMYAQTIAYGLLSARVSRPAGLVADDVAQMVPITSPFLRELMETFLTVGGRKDRIDFDELGVSEVVDVLREAKMEAVLRDFGDKNPQEDPVIHFYELFLKEYDAKKRMQRGVFYTPRPVVSFIVRSVDELLRVEFGLEDGLADTTTWGEMAKRFDDLEIPEGATPDQAFVQILDPATGTGTFLVEVVDVIHQTMVAKWKKLGHTEMFDIPGLWNEYVPKHLLPRLHGYELMMAPYAIAHMKIGLKLYETGYRFESDERARVYLTNALEPAQDFSGTLAFAIPALAHEAEAVNAIKRFQRFTVVIGNPPYSGHSANSGEWIHNLLRSRLPDDAQSYFEVDGEALNERNPKWLNDDYVKFIRFGQNSISQVGVGLLGMITNHGYFDNPTFRGMRQSLQQSFPAGRLVDLHGNVRKAAKDETDENVFDIQQGVGVGLWSSSPMRESRKGIHYEEKVGKRSKKYKWLLANNLLSESHVNVDPVSPYYLFVPQSVGLREEFASNCSIQDVFLASTMGVTTGRDQLCVSFSKEESLAKICGFTSSLSEADLARRFGLSNKSGWNIAKARKTVRSTGVRESHCQPFCYRPMDQRVLYLSLPRRICG
ncbi:MAG: N-6 DNA methylase [Planctomycetes bacterium]|nr:N-6 DNA methylase [Planctomycetota bacterium]